MVILDQGSFSPELLNALEREWIRYGRALDWRLLNRTDGGDGGPKWSAKQRAQASAARKGKPKSAEWRIAMSLAAKTSPAVAAARKRQGDRQRGVPRSPETRAKISAALIGRPTGRTWTPEQRVKHVAILMGHPVSPKARAEISAKLKGRSLTSEHRANIAAGLSGRPLSEAHKESIRRAQLGSKQQRAYGILAGHLRWHVRRGIVNPDCVLCAESE